MTKAKPSENQTGAKLRKLRKSKGIQAKWVAMTLAISPQYLCDLEHDRRPWKPEMVARYKEAIE